MHVFNWKCLQALIDSSSEQIEDIATNLDVTAQSIQNWKKGVNQPSVQQLPRIAEYFKVSMDLLMISPSDFNIKEEDIDVQPAQED